MFDVYLFGSRAAANAAILAASTGAHPATELMHAAKQTPREGDTFTAQQVANRLASAAKRNGLPAPSPTVLARRIPDALKGVPYATFPYGDDDRTLVVTLAGRKVPAMRTIEKRASERVQAARPALEAARALAPRQLKAAA